MGKLKVPALIAGVNGDPGTAVRPAGRVTWNPVRSTLSLHDGATPGGIILAPMSVFDPCRYGAGRGSLPDDRAAFQRCIDRIVAETEVTGFNGGTVTHAPGIILPPGTYHVSGLVWPGGGPMQIAAQVPGTVTIITEAGQYFCTASGRVNATHVDGILFLGGLGAFRYTATGNNVAFPHSFNRCIFSGYTEAAINAASSDMPYLSVRGCTFFGASGSEAIGIVWEGACDAATIESNQFLQNYIDIKLSGPGQLGAGWSVRNNDFISFGGIAKLCTIWLVARTGGVSIGAGVIGWNKFGNENMTAGAPRILLAKETVQTSSGVPISNPALRRPVLDWDGAPGNSQFTGLQIIGNSFQGGAAALTTPIVRSYVGDIRQLTWRDNKTTGTAYTYGIEFMGERQAQYVNQNWDVDIGAGGTGAGGPFSIGFTNIAVGPIEDPAGYMPHGPGVRLAKPTFMATDHLTLADGQLFASVGTYGGAAKAAFTDPYTGQNGVEITCTSQDSGMVMAFPAMPANAEAYVQAMLGQGATNPLLFLEMQVQRNGRRQAQQSFGLAAGLRGAVFPFTTAEDGAAGWQLVFKPRPSNQANGFAAGVATTFRVFSPFVNVGREPARLGHNSPFAPGLWNTAHTVMGTFHLWLTAAGVLRIKNGAPTSELDGAAVGAQS